MKKYIYLLSIIVLISYILSSCKKETIIQTNTINNQDLLEQKYYLDGSHIFIDKYFSEFSNRTDVKRIYAYIYNRSYFTIKGDQSTLCLYTEQSPSSPIILNLPIHSDTIYGDSSNLYIRLMKDKLSIYQKEDDIHCRWDQSTINSYNITLFGRN